jgi:anti-anti-sigma regulatory factor
VNNHDPQACFLLPWPDVTDAQTRDALEIEGRFVGLKSRDAWIVKAVGETAIDSAGLELLASTAKRVRAKGLSFCLVGPSASVRQSLRAAGLDTTIVSFATDEHALARIAEDEPSQTPHPHPPNKALRRWSDGLE